jgi:hypothetical protein
MFRAHSLLALSLVSLACSGRGASPVAHAPTPVAPSPDASAVADAAVVVTPAACPPRARSLREGERVEVVASEAGLREIGDDGAALRTLSSTSAARPRYTPDRRAVLFLAVGSAEVRRLSLDDCSEARVAALPRGVGARCEGSTLEADYDPTRYVQSEDGAGFTSDGSALCLDIMDRNINMMSVEVLMRVPLDGSPVSQRIMAPEGCETPRVAPGTPRLCEPAPQPAPPAHAPQPYAIEGNRIVRHGPRGTTTVAAIQGSDVNVDAVSASGRWQAFSANIVEGDTIARDLLLFDAQTGHIHAAVEGAFPPPLDARTIRAIGGVHGHTAVVWGETDIRFLGASERLWVGGLLVIPGERGINLEGHLAH